MSTFHIVRVRVSKSIILAARVPLQGDAVCDRENVACVRAQLRHFARTGKYVPDWSSEPGLDEADWGIRVTRERVGATITRTRTAVRRG